MHIPESLAEGFPGLGKYIRSWRTLSESRADSPMVTLYFRFHSGPMKGRETLVAFSILKELICAVFSLFRGIQGSHEFCSQVVFISLL